MRLGRIVEHLERAGVLARNASVDAEITGVTDDSRRVAAGTLFCAMAGSNADGHDFLADAARRGAAAALVTQPNDAVDLPQVVVRDGRVAVALAAACWYGEPGRAMYLVGVTGTNGKSTTVALIRHLLNEDGTIGSIGTVGARDGRGTELPEGVGLTTPGPVELQATLAALRDRGTTGVVMEVSSHALDQRRVAGLTFRAAVYTNLTHDHLDYHGDYDHYLAAKALLSAQLPEGGLEVVNADDPAWSALVRRPGVRRVTFGQREPADVCADAIVLGAAGAEATIAFGQTRLRARIPLVGEFNVSNALAAAATVWGLGGAPERIVGALRDAPQVPGRMERLVAKDYVVVRDYAHTPDALQRALEALRPVTTGRLIALFGAGGDRDRRKRPAMGAIAARLADLAILTSDNPRTEDPERILDDVEEGMGGVAHLRITDRREAIHRALATLQPGDCLLLAGKGHETYQVVGTEKRPFDERTIVLDALGAGER